MPFYAVKNGRVPGIYSSWKDCKDQVADYPNAWFKKFKTEIEADRCMKSRRKINIDESIKYIYQENTARTLSPGDVQFLKLQVEIIREKVAKCIQLFSKKMRMLSKRLDMVEYDVNSISPGSRKWERLYSVKADDDPYRYPSSLYPQDQFFPPSYANSPSTIYSSESNSLSAQEDWLDSLYDKHLKPVKWNSNSINETWNHPLDTRNTFIPPLIEDKEGFIDVYIDGAVKHLGTEQARGGIGVWFNQGHPLNIADALEGYPTIMNAEIQAATRAIQQAAAAGLRKLNIHTDSSNMIYAITKWIKFWKTNNWRTPLGSPVDIKEELEQLEDAVNSMEAIKWTYIQSHQGNEGNENADILAHSGVFMNGQKRFYKYNFPEELKSQKKNNINHLAKTLHYSA